MKRKRKRRTNEGGGKINEGEEEVMKVRRKREWR